MTNNTEEEIELKGRTGNLDRTAFAYSPSQTNQDRGYWQGGITDRLRVARKTPQAVIKITSHNHGKAAVKRRLDYISREGELMLETELGERLLGKEETKELLEEWSVDFGKRENGRDSTSIVLSFPKGVDSKVAYVIAQEFLEEQYGHNWQYAFAGHKDTDNFHVHAVIKTIGMNGKALPTLKADLREWRINMAEKAREHGIKLDASPRFARGADKTNFPFFQTERIDPWIKGAHVKALDRGNIGTILEADKDADKYRVEFINPDTGYRMVKTFKSEEIQPVHVPKEAIKAAREEALKKNPMPEAVETAMFDRNRVERKGYAEAALNVAEVLPEAKNDKAVIKLLDAIKDLTRFAKDMSDPNKKLEADYIEKAGGHETKNTLKSVKELVIKAHALDKAKSKGDDIDRGI